MIVRTLVFFRSRVPAGATCKDDQGVTQSTCEAQIVGGFSALPDGRVGWDGLVFRVVPPWPADDDLIPLRTTSPETALQTQLNAAFAGLMSRCEIKLFTKADLESAPLDAAGKRMAAVYIAPGRDAEMPLAQVCCAGAHAAPGPWTVELTRFGVLTAAGGEVSARMHVSQGHVCVRSAMGRIPEY